jgi:hypothetical protein
MSGGGGGGQPTNTTSTVQNTNLPAYAQPYVENMMSAAQQQVFQPTTDASGNTTYTSTKPYTPYSDDPSKYFAGFSPMQEQSFSGAANLQTPDQFGQGSALTGMAGLGSLNAGRNFQNMATDPNQVQAYMNPYLQASLQPQLAEIQRQYGVTGTQQASQATQQGAFGGGRDAIMAAENERNKNTAMNQTIGQGYNTAFNNAQSQMNTGAQLGLQGLGQAGQMGSNLANIGGQQLGAQQNILNMQNQMGAQQQNQQQNIINQGVQNYANAQQYPYMQLGYLSNLLHGLPLQSATTQTYQANPTGTQQLMGLGLGAAGAYKAFGG